MTNSVDVGVIKVALANFDDVINSHVFPMLLETFLYAIFVVLIVTSSTILVRKGLRNLTNRGMFIVTILMFTMSTICWTCDVRTLWNDLKIIIPGEFSDNINPSEVNETTNGSAPWNLTLVVANNICVILSDTVVVWRAWIVSGRDRRFAILALIILASLIVNDILSTLVATVAYYPSFKLLAPLEKHALITGVLWYILSAAINVISTSLIAYKAWCHRRDIRQVLNGAVVARYKVERILLMVVDVGIIYTLLWCTYFAVSSPAYFTDGDRIIPYYLDPIFYQITGLHPTVIIILAALQKSRLESQFSYDGADGAPAEARANRRNATLSGFVARSPGTFSTSQGIPNSSIYATSEYSFSKKHLSGDITDAERSVRVEKKYAHDIV